MASESEDDLNNASEMEEDLFGDEEEGVTNKVRELSDQDLDSGDDEGRNDRVPEKVDEDEEEEPSRDARVLEATLWRHTLPKPADGEFSALRMPLFLGIEPQVYDPMTFEIPVVDHHSNSKSADFSAATTSATTMRYRKGFSGKLESNTVVYKWADGSTTISVGDQHYELQTKSLAPPKNKAYQEVEDSHTYFASPSIVSQLLLLVGHLRNQYSIRPNKDVEDDALEKLQRSLAAATRKDDRTLDVVANVDPELQKKQAELAEKERAKAQRRRENAADKAIFSGSRRGAGGLTVDGLEGRGRRAPGSGRKPQGAKRARQRPEYDSDDELPRGRHREDEYDKEDDFLASSDEELEEVDEGEEEEEEELDDSGMEEPKAKKQKTSTRQEGSDVDADADAEADLLDDEVPAPAPVAAEPSGGRGRKRNVIEDDDDE